MRELKDWNGLLATRAQRFTQLSKTHAREWLRIPKLKCTIYSRWIQITWIILCISSISLMISIIFFCDSSVNNHLKSPICVLIYIPFGFDVSSADEVNSWSANTRTTSREQMFVRTVGNDSSFVMSGYTLTRGLRYDDQRYCIRAIPVLTVKFPYISSMKICFGWFIPLFRERDMATSRLLI